MVESSIPILRRCVGFAGLGTPPMVISGGEMLGHFPGYRRTGSSNTFKSLDLSDRALIRQVSAV